MVNPKPAVDIRAELAKTLFSSEGEDVLSDLCACARVEQFEVATLLNAANQPLEWLRLVVQGLVILFTGALDQMVRMLLVWLFSFGRKAAA